MASSAEDRFGFKYTELYLKSPVWPNWEASEKYQRGSFRIQFKNKGSCALLNHGRIISSAPKAC